MKRIQRFLFCIAAFILVLCSGTCAFAQDYDYEPYYIKDYDITINVREDNTLEVTENIGAFFNENRHGIFRTIPLENYVERADGTVSSVRAKIKNIDVSEKCDIDKSFGQCTIQIGDEDQYISGDHQYTISYEYELGEDRNQDFDELYYNLIGDQWDTYIQNITFKITMPKEFDSSLLGFSAGTYGTVGTSSVEYNVDGNVISGNMIETLPPYNALTMRVELPDDYFYFNKTAYYLKLASLVAVPACALIVVFAIWAKFGKDKKIVKVVEFYPPDNMSSADVAYWHNGTITNKDIVPLLIELANEGYIEINEVEVKKLIGKKKSFQIKKMKDVYDGHDKNKHRFFNGLFKCSGSDIVYEDDLKDSFYVTLDLIREKYNSEANIDKVFDLKSLYLRFFCWVVSIASIIASIYISTVILGGSEKNIFTAAGVIVGLIAFVIAFFIRRRTDDGHQILQRIEGFKMFLETAEKDRLETLVEENPKYFYDILPYAYVLGVSDKWISKFESIAIEPAAWYGGYSTFDYYVFYSFMNRTVAASTKAMTSSPQQSSSGGLSGGGSFSSGGGGFSGGGVGGGGGGSW